jgi:hypothetical protein
MGLHLLTHLLSLSAVAAAAMSPQGQPTAGHSIIELRQYKLAAGKQSEFVRLFDSKFVETQEAVGIRLIGQFTDHDRPDRFTWIREFPDMPARQSALEAFYFGPVWAANKATANPMLDDNDNVLLLRAAAPDSAFGKSEARPTANSATRHRMVFAIIEYLWKQPTEGFSAFFLNEVRPQLANAGLPVLGAYLPEEAPNNFPRLPVRTGEKVFVWFTAAQDAAEFDHRIQRLHQTASWRTGVAPRLADYQERSPQILRLDPTPRSALR